jgi:hypothetical protein
MGVVAIVAGLIGGLVGGGVVAAFSDDGHDRPGPARFERGVPPGFRGYYGRRPNGRWAPPNRRNMPWPGRPGASGRPAPEPSPKTTG